jgi:hypothetical protein
MKKVRQKCQLLKVVDILRVVRHFSISYQSRCPGSYKKIVQKSREIGWDKETKKWWEDNQF